MFLIKIPYQLLPVGKQAVSCFLIHLHGIINPFHEPDKRIKTSNKADCKVDGEQDDQSRASKCCGLGECTVPADEQEEFNKQIIHDSYLQQIVYCVFHYTHYTG